MKLLKFDKIFMGKNNCIGKNVHICKNVIIGDNNKIYSNCVIYPNTKIGNNNIILNNCTFGEHPVDAKEIFNGKKYGGLEIGDNNFFHANNMILNGSHRKTQILNNNKILGECFIGSGTHIKNNVVMYPRSATAGITTLQDFSVCGMGSIIQQRSVLGKYSMIGMGNIASHNVFPYFIYFDQKYTRFNKIKIPSDILIDLERCNEEIYKLIDELKNNNCNKELIKKYNLSKDIVKDIDEFLDAMTIKKI